MTLVVVALPPLINPLIWLLISIVFPNVVSNKEFSFVLHLTGWFSTSIAASASLFSAALLVVCLATVFPATLALVFEPKADFLDFKLFAAFVIVDANAWRWFSLSEMLLCWSPTCLIWRSLLSWFNWSELSYVRFWLFICWRWFRSSIWFLRSSSCN